MASRKTNILLSILLILSLLGCGVLAYLWIDMSISYTYLQSDYEDTDRLIDLSTALLQEEWKELSESAIRSKLESYAATHPERKIVIEDATDENMLFFGGMLFEFESGRLLRIGE